MIYISVLLYQRPSEPKIHHVGPMTDETLRVEHRLQEISDLTKSGTTIKFKSQRDRNVEVLIKYRVKWLLEYVLSGPNKQGHIQPIECNELNCIRVSCSNYRLCY